MKRHVMLPSVPDSVAAAVRFVEAVAQDEGVPAAVTERVLLAMSEAVANAIEHGNHADPERVVRLGWSGWQGGRALLTVEDEGEGLDLHRILGAELPENPYQSHGRGLFLLRTLADRIAVEGACLHLHFASRPEEEA